MFSPKIINRNRERIDRALFKEGLPPLREYSLSEVAEFEDALSEVEWPEGETEGVLRSLPLEAQTYIRNNILLSQISFPYWAERFCTISSSDARLVKLILRPSQRMMLSKLAEQEENNSPLPEGKIGLVIAKARRAGATVFWQAALAHGTMLRPQAAGLTASDIPENTLKLYQIQERIYQNLPGWMKPLRGGKVKADHFHYDLLDSDLTFGTGNQKNPMGQGVRVDFAHLTEFSTWLLPDQVDDDLLPAFLGSGAPTCFFGIESTGKGGKGNSFYHFYQDAKAKKGYFRSLFISWFSIPEIHTLPSEGVEIRKGTLAVADRIKRDSGFECSKEQLAWYQVTREQYESKGKLDEFLQEYPSSDEEAFQFGLKSVFPIEIRQRVRDGCRKPIAVADWNPTTGKFEGMDPVEWDGDPKGRLLMWEKPRPGFIYVVGVDASYGIDEEGKDSAAVEVLRVGNKLEPDEQVAEFWGQMHPLPLAAPTIRLGRMYSDSDGLPAMLAIEVNPGSPGIMTQNEVLKVGYENLYFWRRPLKVGGGFTKEVGWYTTPRTRTWLTETGSKGIKDGELVVNSPGIVEEMASFVNIPNMQGLRHLEHAPGYHDDRLMALFIAFYVSHEADVNSLAQERQKQQAEKERRPEGKLPSFQSMIFMPDGTAVTSESLYEIWEGQVDSRMD